MSTGRTRDSVPWVNWKKDGMAARRERLESRGAEADVGPESGQGFAVSHGPGGNVERAIASAWPGLRLSLSPGLLVVSRRSLAVFDVSVSSLARRRSIDHEEHRGPSSQS